MESLSKMTSVKQYNYLSLHYELKDENHTRERKTSLQKLAYVRKKHFSPRWPCNQSVVRGRGRKKGQSTVETFLFTNL